jgi:AcrR family transcriptional regulator
LYGYFKSKEELFLSVMKMLAEERMSHAYARLVPGGDIAAALQAFGENYLQVILGPDLMAMRGIIAGELVRAGRPSSFMKQARARAGTRWPLIWRRKCRPVACARRMAGLLPCICCPDAGGISADFSGWRGE